MNRLQTTLLLLLVIIYIPVKAQLRETAIKEVKIGDTIPNISIAGILNHQNQKVSINEYYKKGLLIINFWATWCVPCVGELNKLSELSKKHHGRLSVLSIGYEKQRIITEFLLKHTEIDTSAIAVVTDDSQLNLYFPHKFLPHNIWIDRNGVVIAINGSEDITEVNVDAFLNGKKDLIAKKSDDMQFDYKKTYHIADTAFTYRSLLSPYNPTINSGVTWDLGLHANPNDMTRVLAWNATITDLYWLTVFTKFNSKQDEDYSRIEFHVRDSSRFLPASFAKNKMLKEKYIPYNKWGNSNLFCYELKLPVPVPDTVMERYIRNDLDRCFNLNTSIQKRNKPCMIMTLASDSLNLKKSVNLSSQFKFSKGSLIAYGITLDEFISKIAQLYGNHLLPIINETGISYPVDLKLDFNGSKSISGQMILNQLKLYGLSFHQSNRPIDMLIISD